MKTLSFLLISYPLLLASPASAQITFQKTYGGTYADWAASVQQTTDGGYIIAGTTSSFGPVYEDIYLIKINVNGDILWTKTFGGGNSEFAYCVQQTTDGGYIISGTTYTFIAGAYDVYLVKTDVNGNMLWSKTFGGVNPDEGYSVQQTTDGGYIIAGVTSSFGAGSSDVYLIKTDANGNLLWSKTFGGTLQDVGYFVQQTSDGGYIITGLKVNTAGAPFVYLIKTDVSGDTIWTKSFGGFVGQTGRFVQQTSDGGYIVAGNGCGSSVVTCDGYLIKTNVTGDLLWTKKFEGTDHDDFSCVRQTTDGGYIITGGTMSSGAGSSDVYLVKTDTIGDTLWTKAFGGGNSDGGYSVQQTTDGGYIIAGSTYTPGPPLSSVYLIKTDSLGNSGCNEGGTATVVTSPATPDTNFATIVTSPLTIVTTPATIVGSGGIVTTLCSTVGIYQISNSLPIKSGSISPNPSPGNFTITFPDAINNGEIQIFNAYGSKVFSQNIHYTSNTEIHLNDIPGGIYFVKVYVYPDSIGNGEKYFSNKIIIL